LEALQTAIETIVPNGLVACVAQTDDMGIEQLTVFYDGTDTVSLDEVNAVLKSKVGAITAREARKLAKLPLTPSGKLDIETLRNTVNKH